MTDQIKLVIFDLDNTLTTGPTIWELLHRENGTWESHGVPYWQKYRAGEFGLTAFIRKDVACWKGLPEERMHKAFQKVRYIKDAERTVRALNKAGITTALVSSSVLQFAEFVAERFGIRHVFANPIGIYNGVLTGTVNVLVPAQGKGRVTAQLKRDLKVKKKHVLAVGDSVHDIPLFEQSGTTVSFTDAHKNVQNLVDHVISKQHIYRSIIKHCNIDTAHF